MTRPAECLEGKELEGGWLVGKRIKPRPTATGGHFSTGYFVTNADGRTGFLKAMDYSDAFGARDFVDQMKFLADAYIFERDICLRCQAVRITRVVHAMDYGSHQDPLAAVNRVEFLIFERADGDVRAFLDQQSEFDVAFALRTLHGVAAALQQLHLAEMAHQDVKPSNVLIFGEERKSKLGDLGRAWSKDCPAPHDGCRFAGDLGYAPPELRYDDVVDEKAKRYGSDLYLLGSLAVFLFTRVHINGLVDKQLDRSFQSSNLIMTYEDALPYLQAAFADAMHDFAAHVPDSIQSDLAAIVAELCDPDYRRRGNPVRTSQQRYSLQRYVSTFDRLSRRVELEMKRRM
ncbi:MAG: hypothetical protein WD069_08040 [Planctomycetales bacterium]